MALCIHYHLQIFISLALLFTSVCPHTLIFTQPQNPAQMSASLLNFLNPSSRFIQRIDFHLVTVFKHQMKNLLSSASIVQYTMILSWMGFQEPFFLFFSFESIDRLAFVPCLHSTTDGTQYTTEWVTGHQPLHLTYLQLMSCLNVMWNV